MATLLIPGGLPGRSSMIVVPAAGPIGELVWAVKAPGDVLPRAIDVSALLAGLNPALSLDGLPQVQADPSLTVTLTDTNPAGLVWLSVAGGLALTWPMVAVTLPLSRGGTLTMIVAQPIGPAAPAGLVAIPPPPMNALTLGGITLTVDGAPLTVGP